MNLSFDIKINDTNANVNVNKDYKKIAQDFCEKYYVAFDNNFMAIGNLCKNKTKFTFFRKEVMGFNKLFKLLQKHNIYTFKHHNIDVNAQPINDNSLLIHSTGSLSINGSNQKKYSETLILHKNTKNRFYIKNLIIKFI